MPDFSFLSDNFPEIFGQAIQSSLGVIALIAMLLIFVAPKFLVDVDPKYKAIIFSVLTLGCIVLSALATLKATNEMIDLQKPKPTTAKDTKNDCPPGSLKEKFGCK